MEFGICSLEFQGLGDLELGILAVYLVYLVILKFKTTFAIQFLRNTYVTTSNSNIT